MRGLEKFVSGHVLSTVPTVLQCCADHVVIPFFFFSFFSCLNLCGGGGDLCAIAVAGDRFGLAEGEVAAGSNSLWEWWPLFVGVAHIRLLIGPPGK